MTLKGTGQAGRNKGVLCFHHYFDAGVSGTNKIYLVGADDDTGYSFDSPVRINAMSYQVETDTTDAGATLTFTVAKNTEATAIYASSAEDVASAGSTTGSDSTPSSEANAVLSTDDDLIVVITPASTATLAGSVNVQIDFEWLD